MNQPSEEQNDSPAFRLRPRQAAPKSYFAVRLDFSGSPRSFARSRTSKRKGSSSNNQNSTNSGGGRNSNNNSKLASNNYNSNATVTSNNSNNSNKRYCQQTSSQYHQQQLQAIQLQREQEEIRRREDKRLALRREAAKSIAIDTPISPFLERLHLDDLTENQIYEHYYISLRILKVIRYNNHNNISLTKHERSEHTGHQISTTEPILSKEQLIINTPSIVVDNNIVKNNGNNRINNKSPLIECVCMEEISTLPSDTDEFNELNELDDIKPSSHTISVLFYNDYSNSSLLKEGIQIDIAKFRTSERLVDDSPIANHIIDKKEISELIEDINDTKASVRTLPLLPFSVVVKLDADDTERSQKTHNINSKPPLIPFLTIQNSIENTVDKKK